MDYKILKLSLYQTAMNTQKVIKQISQPEALNAGFKNLYE
jgi:hypothetical protein